MDFSKTMSNQEEALSTVRRMIISIVETRLPRDVSFRSFIEFKKQREFYDKQVKDKNTQKNTKIFSLSLKASIDDTEFEIFGARGWMKSSSVTETSEEQIVECVLKLCQKDEYGETLYLIIEVVSKVAMKMRIM